MSDEKQFLSVDEAAELLRVNRQTIYLAVERGEMPGVFRVGRAIRIRRAAILGLEVAGSTRP